MSDKCLHSGMHSLFTPKWAAPGQLSRQGSVSTAPKRQIFAPHKISDNASTQPDPLLEGGVRQRGEEWTMCGNPQKLCFPCINKGSDILEKLRRADGPRRSKTSLLM